MKRQLLKITSVFLLIFTISCEDYLDINEDPNVLSSTDQAKIILPTAEVNLANTLMGWDLGFGGGFWSEYWTQSYTASQFKTLCEYEDGSATSFENAYEKLTAGVLIDTQRIKALALANEETGYVYISEALAIYTWQVITDLWGEIPYTEALKGNTGVLAPAFEKGEDIYVDLEVRVDQLLATDINTLSEIDADYDFIYGGDLTKWKQFVNSLKLKIMMRQSETEFYNNDEVISFVSGTTFLSESAKISGSYWKDSEEEKRHPMREFEEGGASYLSTNVIGCKNFIDYLKSNGDPRLEVLFVTSEDEHEGAFFGDFDARADSDADGILDADESYSKASFAPDSPLMILSDWEINFFIAEAHARAGDVIKAKQHYDLGVLNSFTQHGINDKSIIVSGYASWVNGNVEENIKQIAMQKWVANAHYQHCESFIERNRTKYPTVDEIDIKLDRQEASRNFPIGSLTISVNGRDKTNGFLPSSPIYPSDILGRNTNAPGQKRDLLEKIWWDKKTGK
ncbi:SusD/RagB family nutrient-binding outer membrane lipoprotein [Wenyingzhuangia sp.]|uniref:SusD/RagB family nutrient-binding outer membrane lipoprotein n=1 Tax=Wenyingzhuangia sp. TaxID=1964193 RepID=UPI00321B8A7D